MAHVQPHGSLRVKPRGQGLGPDAHRRLLPAQSWEPHPAWALSQDRVPICSAVTILKVLKYLMARPRSLVLDSEL